MVFLLTWLHLVYVFIIYVSGLMEQCIMGIRGVTPSSPLPVYWCKHPSTPKMSIFLTFFLPSYLTLVCLSHPRAPHLFDLFSFAPHLRTGGPAASAGQRHAGRDWHVPVDGGDGEAGSAPRPRGGEGPLLHLHRLPSARRGEEDEDAEWLQACWLYDTEIKISDGIL